MDSLEQDDAVRYRYHLLIMKCSMKKYMIILAAALVGLSACEKIESVLDLIPQSSLSPESYFRTETDLQLFTNSLYVDVITHTIYTEQSDLFIRDNPGDIIRNGNNRITPASGGGWTWTTLRKVNVCLEYMEKNCDDEKVYNTYSGLCRFFRAWIYFDKVARFGDVPWLDHVAGSSDEILYQARDSRELVLTHMIEDADYAAEKLPESYGGTTYRATKWAALALKARFCLFEGTFRKYHGITLEGHDANYYLQQAADAANKIMTESPHKLFTTDRPNLDYALMFTQFDATADEFIFSTRYGNDNGYYHNGTAINLMNSQGRYSMTKKAVCSYLMADGSRYTDIPGWETKMWIEETVNRDPRLGQTMRTPGYHRIDYLEKSKKYDYSGPELGLDLLVPLTGYQNSKYLMPITNTQNDKFDQAYNDLPIIRLAEIYLIYAEAKAELGTLTQNDLDKSVNLLRDRVGMPHMNMAQANANPDPFLCSGTWGFTNVSGANKGVILEIRRERGVEMAEESLRYRDLIRWKAGYCIGDQPMYGLYFPGPGVYDLDGDGKNDVALYTASETKPDSSTATYIWKIGTDVFLSNKEAGGYIEPYQNLTITFDENRDYFYPIPLDDISLNNNLTQNPGWDDIDR